MQDFFLSILPLLICLIGVGLPILIVSSILLVRDLAKMRQEPNQELWYQRPSIRGILMVMGYSLFVVLLALGFGITALLPGEQSRVTMKSILFGGITILLILCSYQLISSLRKILQDHRKGILPIWYKRPKFLRQIGQTSLWIGLVWEMGFVEHLFILGFPYSRWPWNSSYLYWNIILSAVIPGLFCLVSLAFHLYAAFLQAYGYSQ